MRWGHRHTDLEVIAIRSTRNRGAGAARNMGATAAKGDFLWFLDADDELLPPHFAAGIVAMDNSPNIGAFVSRIEVTVDVHPEWIPSINNSSVVNLCVRKACHDYISRPLENECFRKGHEDGAYRLFLSHAFVVMKSDIKTVRYNWRPGNSLDRQLPKLQRPIGDRRFFVDDKAPDDITKDILTALRDLSERTDELPYGPRRRRPGDMRDEWATFAGARFFDRYAVKA